MNILGQNNVRINFKKADSSSKEFAFMKAHELNNIEHLITIPCNQCGNTGKLYHGDEEIDCYICKGYGHYYTKNIWRTGKTTNTQLIVETDSSSKENLSLIVNHLQKLFGYKFNTIKTLHGFHIIGEKKYPPYIDHLKKQLPSADWYDANALVLNNNLNKSVDYRKPQNTLDYISKILKMDEELREYQYSTNYKGLFTTSLKNSGLLNCVGDFDILYTVLSLKYGKSTLRISKKQDSDKYEEVTI